MAARDNLITVGDNGVGIAEGERESVFVEFFRGGRGKGGFGLGLAICRRIMALHEGAVRIASSSGEGTVFELSFPPGSGMVSGEASNR